MHPVISHQLFHAQPRFLHPRKKKNRSLLSPHILVSSTWICSILMYHTRVPNCAKKYEKYGHWKYPPFGFFPHTKSYVHLNSHLLRGLVAGCGLLNVHGFTLKRTGVHKSYVALQKKKNVPAMVNGFLDSRKDPRRAGMLEKYQSIR